MESDCLSESEVSERVTRNQPNCSEGQKANGRANKRLKQVVIKSCDGFCDFLLMNRLPWSIGVVTWSERRHEAIRALQWTRTFTPGFGHGWLTSARDRNVLSKCTLVCVYVAMKI